MKMNIKLHPIGYPTAEQLIVDVEGLIIYVNGVAHDFSPLNPGDVLPATAVESGMFVGDIVRTAEGLDFTLQFRLGPYAPEEACFPAPITVTEDGSVAIPAFRGNPPDSVEMPPIPELPNEDRLQPETDRGEFAGLSPEEVLRFADPTPPGGVPAGE